MHSQIPGELTMVLVTAMKKIVDINTYNPRVYTPPICKTVQIAVIQNKYTYISNYSSIRSTFSFSNLSSHFTSIRITTFTLSFLVISSCETSQKL